MSPVDLLKAYQKGELEVTDEGIEHLASPFPFEDPRAFQKELEAQFEGDVKRIMEERHVSRPEAEDIVCMESDKEEQEFMNGLPGSLEQGLDDQVPAESGPITGTAEKRLQLVLKNPRSR